MDGVGVHDASEYVETDPTGRYGRYNDILGKGASKIVFRAFDEYEGIEVAWNQVKLNDFLQSPEDLERLYSEIHLLKTLNHKNIMTFYSSWVDITNRNINFVTEMFTSGTLRQYRLKHKKVNIRAVKHWCRQILSGLLYLHNHDPPVIHRDLKCDNIFINGNQGEVKIGDLGLAAILRKSHAVRCVGTPEFMAPEVYEEEYNELVDIYSFGMCVLEMVTFEYPYSECHNPAQIYKKVISGKKPDSLYKVVDPEVSRFVEKCLATVSSRLPASELLKDSFLQTDDYTYVSKPLYNELACGEAGSHVQAHPFDTHQTYRPPVNGFYNIIGYDPNSELDCQWMEFETSDIDLFISPEDEHSENMDISIKGKKRGDGGVFLRLRIADKEGLVRNIYFPFDTETDTALSVATEMVAELDIIDQDVTELAELIDEEITKLVPNRKRGSSIKEAIDCTDVDSYNDCISNGYPDHPSSDNSGSQNSHSLHLLEHGSTSTRGRFEEITYQVDSNEQPGMGSGQASSCRSSSVHYTDIWAQHDGRELCLQRSLSLHFEKAWESLDGSKFEDGKKINNDDGHSRRVYRKPCTPHNSPASSLTEDYYENEIRRELRWLKAKYQMQLQELTGQKMGAAAKDYSGFRKKRQEHSRREKIDQGTSVLGEDLLSHLPADLCGENCTDSEKQKFQNCGTSNEALLPQHSLHRAMSLPVDAVDC